MNPRPRGVRARRRAGRGFAVVVLAALAGCAGGYEYIPPVKVTFFHVDPNETVDLIPYRTLRTGDYQAQEPAVEYRAKKDKIAAQTTIFVFADRAIVDAVEVPGAPDSVRWEANVDELTWRAVMVPAASWWNPKKREGGVVPRILAHEQIHFAIAEVGARRENALASETTMRIRAAAPTPVAALKESNRRLQQESKRIELAVQAWHAKYDMETKNGTDAVAQAIWASRLERMIAESE